MKRLYGKISITIEVYEIFTWQHSYNSSDIFQVSTIQWVPGAFSLGLKRMGHEADHSPPSSAEVNNVWSYTSISLMFSWRGAQLKKAQGQLYLLPYLTCQLIQKI
jgi:hypothetical protein